MEEETIQAFFGIFFQFSNKSLSIDESITKIKAIIEKENLSSSILFDVITALNFELADLKENEDVQKLLSNVTKQFLPPEILLLDVGLLGADEISIKSRIVKSKTRVYYKQIKFNLLREESEGYAKLITEILDSQTSSNQILLVIKKLIGQFNLDPNRVIDVLLDCFENNISDRELYVNTLRKFKINREELGNILLLKFVFCDNINYTPMDLYRVASILSQENLIDLMSLFFAISPKQSKILEENIKLIDLVKKRAAKAEIISTGSIADASINNASSSMANDMGGMSNGIEPPNGMIVSISFDAANQSQILEDKKLAGLAFDDTEILPKNQKLGLICALLEQGAWSLAKQLLDRMPEGYVLGISRRISSAIANIIGYSIENFYREKYLHWKAETTRTRESWKRFTFNVEKLTKWEDFQTIIYPLISYLGPYIGTRQEVAIKLLRLILIFLQDEKLKSFSNYESLYNTIMDICDEAIVPATSLLQSNFAYCEELWQVLQCFSYQDRYRIYGQWKNVYSIRCWDLNIQRGKVLGMTKYLIKRLSKDTAKLIGRQLGKLCHIYPMVALNYVLDKVQDFQNFIVPVVESMRFLSNLEYDVLSYCLIEHFSAPEKDELKSTDVVFNLWLTSLATFSAATYRRYPIDFSGILQYVTNQLKDNKNFNLIVLRELIANISGVESGTDLTQENLEALCGGDLLRQEAGYSSVTKVNKRATARLRDALLKNDLFESLSILLGQQKNYIIYLDSKEFPLKLTCHMLDQNQETFVQFYFFLRANLKADEYARRMPSAFNLLSKYHVPIEVAMCLTRSIYLNKIITSYEISKKNLKEDNKIKLDGFQKTSLYKNSFDEAVNKLEEELINSFPESFWLDITSRLYTTFWLLSVNDLSAPLTAYEREIDKCKKELLEANHDTGSSKSKRNSKDEERLKNLEQKLIEEMRKQTEHAKRIKEILATEKEVLFAATQNRTSQMVRFFQSCILPRAIFSEVDAVYCAKFVETLHVIRTGYFQTIVFFDKIFTDVTPILASLTERETNCFGRFCCMCLDIILKWHSSKAVFQMECEGYPGCITKIRKRESDEASAVEFTYEYYRTICYKWQIRLVKSLGFILMSTNYVLIRNALTFMIKILSNFPILTSSYKTVEKNVTSLRDNEKGKRSDLNLLAQSYLVQLTKRNTRLYKHEEFFDAKVTSANTSDAKNNSLISSTTNNNNKTPQHRKRTVIEAKIETTKSSSNGTETPPKNLLADSPAANSSLTSSGRKKAKRISSN